jgi:hypothetical protein
MKLPWQPVEGTLDDIVRELPRPLEAIANGEVPAVILRGAFPRPTGPVIVERLIERDLLYDPKRPVPAKFLEESIPEGTVRPGLDDPSHAGSSPAVVAETAPLTERKRRIDIGSSLGYRGSDPEGFFEHAAKSNRLLASLFEGLDDPIETLYDGLASLSIDQRAVTAHEPEGPTYCRAIVRAHYGNYTYHPHFDSVRLRERRETYAVHRFEHQFAGVLVLQNAEAGGKSAQCIIHRYLWQEEVQPHLDAGTFHEFAKERGIESCRVELEPGDLYFFNTRSIHEVPGLDGELPRVVLATFIGYSAGEKEMFVWS